MPNNFGAESLGRAGYAVLGPSASAPARSIPAPVEVSPGIQGLEYTASPALDSIRLYDLTDAVLREITVDDNRIYLSGVPASVAPGDLAVVAFTGSAADLTGTLADARLSSNVPLKNTANIYAALNTFTDVVTTGTVQVGGAGAHLLRWHAGAASLEVRDSTNSWYRKTRVGELQVIADLGGSNATPSNARLAFLTQIGGYIAGAISGRTYSANAAHGDIVISAAANMTTGQNDYSGLTDDLVLRGNTGNVEINRGLLGVGMAGQSARSISILPQNTSNRTGVRVYDYGAFVSDASQSGFEVAYMGGTFAAPSTTVAGHSRNLLSFRTGGSAGALSTVPSFAIRSTIGSIIGSALSEVNTSLMVTPTSTGVPIAALTMFGQSGLVDFPVGQIQLGTNVRLKNSSGDLQIRNSGDTDFAGLFAGAANFSNVVSASNGIKVSGSAGIQHSSVTPVATSGSIAWMDYTGNSNLLYRRDVVNGRMHVTYTQGATAALALTQFHSRVTVDDRLVVSSGQTGNTLQATFTNTTANEPAGFRMNNGSWDIGFRTNPGGQGWFEISGTSSGIQHRWVAKNYLLASDGRIYFSAETNFATAGTGAQDLGIGRASAGTLRIYNSAGNDGSLQALNGVFSGTVTSAFQTLSSDPSTLDIGTGMSRLIKNTTSGKIAKFVNDGGVIKEAGSTDTVVTWSNVTGKPNPITNIANGLLAFRIDGGGVAPTTGAKNILFRVPYNCTITGWELVADVSGSIVVDIWKDTYANYAPTNADSITASAKPTLSSAIKANSTTLTGWTTTLNAGDYIELEVESASTLTVVVLTLTVTKT